MTATASKLNSYQHNLNQLASTPSVQTLLTTLLARDEVQDSLQQNGRLSVEQVTQLTTLDQQLQQQPLSEPLLADFPTWRQIQPTNTLGWWWHLDEQQTEAAATDDAPFLLIGGIILTCTLPFVVEIWHRLWNDAPDLLSIYGTLGTLLLAGGPLVKQIRQLFSRLAQHLPKTFPLKPHRYAESGVALAIIAFLVVQFIWWGGLPRLGQLYNYWGVDEQAKGNIAQAEQYYRRSVAFAPNEAVPYLSLGQIYQAIGQPNVAEEWYQQAIVQNRNLGLAYADLGTLYNQQEAYPQAAAILQAGLAVNAGTPLIADNETAVVTQYKLLAALGQTHFEQGNLELAVVALREAINLEPILIEFEQAEASRYRQALPHIYLAQYYEQQGKPELAHAEWQACLSFLPRSWETQLQRQQCQTGYDR